MKPKNLKTVFLLCMVSGALAVTFNNCTSKGPDVVSNTDSTADSIFSFEASYVIPEDVDSNANDTLLAMYAWQEFLALNWKSSYSVTGMKGMPDTSWTFFSDTTVAAPDTLVWETYAHRTELSPAMYPMRPFDAGCHYSYTDTPVAGETTASFTLLHNLDETSEIGSCNLFAFANSGNLYSDTNFLVRYQAKTNRVEYDYIRDTLVTQARLKSAVKNAKANIDSLYNNPNYISDSVTLFSLPNGSIEVKSAWRPLRAGENASEFLTRKVIVYSGQPTTPKGNTFYYFNKTYALIGLHIIHKSKNHPSFVFATWEHEGVVTQDSMQYVLLTQNFSKPQTDSLGYMTPIRNPIPAIDSLATAYVHTKLLPKSSVWRHYRLVGVQGRPTSDSTRPNAFLANYVIESDRLLARFRGSGFASPFDGKPNVLYNHNLYTVGGCQGCHGGGAQHSGTDFSFIVNSPNSAPDAVAGKPDSTINSIASKFKVPKLTRLKQQYSH